MDIQEVLSRIKRIEIRTRKLVNEQLAGEYHSVFKGRGMEFSDVREYIPGDDFRTIDWNVSARHGVSPENHKLYVKQFVEERELTVIFLVDASGSLSFGTRGRLKSELTAEIVALLAFSAIRNHDRVGLCIFADNVELFIPPRKGQEHTLRLIREILYFKPKGKGTNITGALEYLGRVLTKKGVLFIISDFMCKDYEKRLALMALKHDVISLIIRDEIENKIPKVGIVEMLNPEGDGKIYVNTNKKAFRDSFWVHTQKRNEAVKSFLSRHNIDSIEFLTGKDYSKPLIRFFEERASRMRK